MGRGERKGGERGEERKGEREERRGERGRTRNKKNKTRKRPLLPLRKVAKPDLELGLHLEIARARQKRRRRSRSGGTGLLFCCPLLPPPPLLAPFLLDAPRAAAAAAAADAQHRRPDAPRHEPIVVLHVGDDVEDLVRREGEELALGVGPGRRGRGGRGGGGGRSEGGGRRVEAPAANGSRRRR